MMASQNKIGNRPRFIKKNSKLFIDHELQINTQYTEQNIYLKT